jgi:hypothetical protein
MEIDAAATLLLLQGLVVGSQGIEIVGLDGPGRFDGCSATIVSPL